MYIHSGWRPLTLFGPDVRRLRISWYYKIHQRKSMIMHFLLGPTFLCCLAFACPRVPAWLTGWLVGEREGNSNFSIQSESQRGSGPASAVSWSSAPTNPTQKQHSHWDTLKLSLLRLFWKGRFQLNQRELNQEYPFLSYTRLDLIPLLILKF